MADIETPLRFTLPIEPLIRELVAAQDPAFDTSRGSAFYDLAVLPASLLFQHFGDYARVIARNQTLGEYASMLPAELDRLVSNYGIQRFTGQLSKGVVRVAYASPRTVTVSQGVRFSSTSGHKYEPVSAVTVTEQQMAANQITATGEYYLDVAVKAVAVGAAYSASAGSVSSVTGLSGYTRVFNPSAFLPGLDAESNSALYQRTIQSIANRDLVKADSITAAIVSNFSTVTHVSVVGYGDALMTRDTAEVALADYPLISQSFCQKVNVPLDGDGQIQWTDASGTEIVNPIGGRVGAIYDLLTVDFTRVPLSSTTSQGIVQEYRAVQPGDTITIGGTSPDAGEYRVRDQLSAAAEAGGADRRLLVLDRPFSDTTPSAAITDTPYSVSGRVYTRQFHVGGAIDVYISSSSEVSAEVIVNTATVEGDTVEIPIVESDASFEDEGFTLPVATITKVEKIDPSTGDVLLELTPDTQWIVVSGDQKTHFTPATSDTLILRGSEVDSLTGLTLPLFSGSRIRVTYLHSPDVPLVDAYIQANKDVTTDIEVLPAKFKLVDVELEYTGGPTVSDAEAALKTLIDGKGFGAELTAQEVAAVVTDLGATDVTLPLTLRSRFSEANGTFSFGESPDRLTVEANQVFRLDTALLTRR